MWCGLGGEMKIRGKFDRFYPDLQGIPVRQEVVGVIGAYSNFNDLNSMLKAVEALAA